jgi:hypothetical protein
MGDVFPNILNFDSQNICQNFGCFERAIKMERCKIIKSLKTQNQNDKKRLIRCVPEMEKNGLCVYRNTILYNDDIEIIELDFNISKGVYFIFYSFLFPEIKVFDIFYSNNSIKCKYCKSSFLLLTNYFWISKRKKKENSKMCIEWDTFQNILNILINSVVQVNRESVDVFRDFILKINLQWGHIKIKVSFCGCCQEDSKIGPSCKSGKHILYCFDCEKAYTDYYWTEKCLFCCK